MTAPLPPGSATQEFQRVPILDASLSPERRCSELGVPDEWLSN